MTLHGEEVIPLSKLVKELALKQGNMKETNIFQQLAYARWAWKELFRKYIWEIKNQVLPVCPDTNTIQLPNDCERLVNLYVVDYAGKLQPITPDPGLNTVQINCIQSSCSCNTCHGEGTLCAAAESGITYTTETVTIQDVEYTMQIWTRYSNGAIQQEKKIPTYNVGTGSVVYNTEIETLCNIETTTDGCIRPTAQNMEYLRSYCGCDTFPNTQTGIYSHWYNTTDLISQPYNYFGYWNVNANDRSIIHIFRNDHKNLHAGFTGICKVIAAYQTNGEISGDEIMVPQYAQFAMDMGILWQQKLFNNRAALSEKVFAKAEWRAACVNVNKHLNPIKLEIIKKLQSNKIRW